MRNVELKLETVVNCLIWVLRSEPWPRERAANTFTTELSLQALSYLSYRIQDTRTVG